MCKKKLLNVNNVFIIGPPDAPRNCTVTNITVHTLTLECLPGFNGGSDQTFYLEVYSSNSKHLRHNLTSTEYPFFVVHGLPAGNTFLLMVYSSNSKGKSTTVTITGSTLLAAHWQSGQFIYLRLCNCFSFYFLFSFTSSEYCLFC